MAVASALVAAAGLLLRCDSADLSLIFPEVGSAKLHADGFVARCGSPRHHVPAPCHRAQCHSENKFSCNSSTCALSRSMPTLPHTALPVPTFWSRPTIPWRFGTCPSGHKTADVQMMATAPRSVRSNRDRDGSVLWDARREL